MQNIKINNIDLKKIDSVIISKFKELEFLENRLKYTDILKKNNVIFKLLYRASRDGKSMQTFHNKCDNVMGTLSIVKTTKGMKFRGYTEQNWNNNDTQRSIAKKDAKNICFCFSLDLFKIYNFNDNYNQSIICYYRYGPYFHAGESPIIYITNNNGCLIGSTQYYTSYDSFGKFDINCEINNGEMNFSVVELEVFQILFDN